MKYIISFLFLVLFLNFYSFGQNKFKSKFEFNFVQYGDNLIMVDPGPNWKGYNINKNAIQTSYIIEKERVNKICYGLGVSYLNFQGYHGINVFANIENPERNKKISPLFESRIGYSKIWNQYKGGTNSVVAQLNMGIRVKIKEKVTSGFFIGMQIGQQSLICPIGLSVKF